LHLLSYFCLIEICDMNTITSITPNKHTLFAEITTAKTERHFIGILELQALNTVANLPNAVIEREGFVTARHSLQLLQKMASLTPQVIAISNDEVVGYVLSMHPELRDELDILKPMFDLLERINYKGNPLASYAIIVGGQTCIAKEFRGSGILENLYAKARQELQVDYELCVTEIAVSNFRSMKAHEKIGFETIHTYNDTNLLWNIVVWDWQTRS
jgi:hypothetical protein